MTWVKCGLFSVLGNKYNHGKRNGDTHKNVDYSYFLVFKLGMGLGPLVLGMF